ncbi:hypothetical protein N7474_001699 [Penicillium riverlandense]|uniref:uncharacterized protein n=1 Tax=Penicillium riverlandense TaxID=1903569 RepID=UPI0025478890|nr:uncharacterized protein N7474_001699 [Penicillium riverlandense]KAJ5833388.1 hypothetical protein N7474_001699 [Penicillium riverlandense]
MLTPFCEAYNVSRQTTNTEGELRLECLFWRIWGSQRLSSTITTQTLDGLVLRIMTPSSHELPATRHGSQAVHVDSDPPTTTILHQHPSVHTQSQTANGTNKAGLHSILKKPHTAQSEPQKTTRLLLEQPDGNSITRNPSNPPTPNMAELNTQENHPARTGQKKTSFAAGRSKRGLRRRPAFNRRSSSQSSVSKFSSPIQSSSHTYEVFGSYDQDDSVLSPHVTAGSDTTTATSWIDLKSVEASLPVPHPGTGTTGTMTPPSPDLAISDKVHPAKRPDIAPAVLAISDKQDPILPQGIETVSDDPQREPTQATKQKSEPEIPSSFEDFFSFPEIPDFPDTPSPPDTTDQQPTTDSIPSSPSLTQLELAEADNSTEMLIELFKIINDRDPLPAGKDAPHVPIRPWFTAQRQWLPAPREQKLFEWMLQDHTSVIYPQPKNDRLLPRNYRAQWVAALNSWKFHIARSRKPGLYSHKKGLAILGTIYEEDEVDEEQFGKDLCTPEKEGEWCDFGSADGTLVPEEA